MKNPILLLVAALLSMTIHAHEATGGITTSEVRFPPLKNSICNYISADTIISFPSETDLRGLVSNQWENIVIFTTFTTNCKSDTVRLYSINAETFGVDTIYIYIKNLRKTIKNRQNTKLSNIAFKSNNLVLKYANTISIFTKQNNTYTLKKEFKTDAYPQHIQFLNDSILVLSDYYYTHTPQTYVSFLNTNTSSIEKTINPHLNNLLLTFFSPKKNFDVKDNTILWANRAEYSFLVFNKNLELKDSIFHNVKDWKNLSGKTLKKALKRSKYDAADIIAIIEKEYYKIDHLQWAYLIDSTHILAVHTKPHNEKTYTFPSIDIWEKNNGQWKLTKTGIDDFAEQTDTIKRNSFALDYLSGAHYHFLNNMKVVKISRCHVVENAIGMPSQEYWLKYWERYQNNDPFLQIVIVHNVIVENSYFHTAKL